MYTKYVLVVLFFVSIKTVATFRCYACSFSAADSDQSCLEITNTTNTVECPFTYCIIVRQEFVDPRGVVASFTRGCEDEPDFLNHESTDDTFRTYYRACTSNLCNIGNGIQSVTGGGLSPHPIYDGGNLLVPGTRNDAPVVRAVLLTFLVITIISYFV